MSLDEDNEKMEMFIHFISNVATSKQTKSYFILENAEHETFYLFPLFLSFLICIPITTNILFLHSFVSSHYPSPKPPEIPLEPHNILE